MVAENYDLARIKDAYLDYQRERSEYLKCPDRDMETRLEQAKRRHAASKAFVNACMQYLDKSDNIVNPESGVRPDVAMYRQITENSPELKEARESEYKARDELWDRVLRKAAVQESHGAPSVSPKAVYGEVLDGMRKAFPERVGKDEFVYGFEEEDLSVRGECHSFENWIETNLRKYKESLARCINELEANRADVEQCIRAVESGVGNADFASKWDSASKARDAFVEKVKTSREKWLDGVGGVDVASVCGGVFGWDGEVAKCFEDMLLQSKGKHEKIIAEREKKAEEARQRREAELQRREAERQRREAELQRQEEERKRQEARCWMTIFVLCCAVIFLIWLLSYLYKILCSAIR